MYRQNKLKEELDNLRKENRRLEIENVALRRRTNTLLAELHNIRLEMQNRYLMDELIKEKTLEPRIIKLDNEVEECQKD